MSPLKIGDKWFVFYTHADEDRRVGPFSTNAEAWRWIERCEGQPISKAEARGEWVLEQMAGGKGL